jgi:hypothetical protein
MLANQADTDQRKSGLRMAIFFYNAAILFILPLALAYLAIQLLVYRRYRESVIARFGRMPRSAEDAQGPFYGCMPFRSGR